MTFLRFVCFDYPIAHSVPHVASLGPPPKPLTQIAEAHARDEAIFDAYASGGYSLKEIGDHFRLHYSRVSRIVKQQRLAKNKA